MHCTTKMVLHRGRGLAIIPFVVLYFLVIS